MLGPMALDSMLIQVNTVASTCMVFCLLQTRKTVKWQGSLDNLEDLGEVRLDFYSEPPPAAPEPGKLPSSPSPSSDSPAALLHQLSAVATLHQRGLGGGGVAPKLRKPCGELYPSRPSSALDCCGCTDWKLPLQRSLHFKLHILRSKVSPAIERWPMALEAISITTGSLEGSRLRRMELAKKRKEDQENCQFKTDWTEKYWFFYRTTPMLNRLNVAVIKSDNLKRHFTSIHAA
ncbi:hypothetical protein F7725_000339 [Dissostichus mawsoni]|uniref:Uncharacterized protein n=1 Tax=Dissostichus mawsoni TaxID=36200 RepID=A0A7J5ZE41_DISMA|nr:hypothetical protein F7725_000339 [Dissostichus mawsoni]